MRRTVNLGILTPKPKKERIEKKDKDKKKGNKKRKLKELGLSRKEKKTYNKE